MSTNNRFLWSLTEEEFQMLIKETIENSFSELLKVKNSSPGDLMTMKDVAAHFKVSLVSIHKWRKYNILPPAIKKGGRVYFVRSQILDYTQKIKK